MLMRRLPQGRRPESVAETFIDMLFQFKSNVLTITTDNGVEFRHHARIAKALNTTVYFADSYTSWQKGAINNTNKLIRQYIQKGIGFPMRTEIYIPAVPLRLTRRPRNKLTSCSPYERFFNLLL